MDVDLTYEGIVFSQADIGVEPFGLLPHEILIPVLPLPLREIDAAGILVVTVETQVIAPVVGHGHRVGHELLPVIQFAEFGNVQVKSWSRYDVLRFAFSHFLPV